MTVLESFRTGDVRALAKVVSHVENMGEGYQDLLGSLYAQAGRSLRVGITGPPGAGKSTLVNTLAHMYLTEGKRIGIIAVDPTSPFTGGALLGDRVRMNEFPMDGSVFFRSMATRGATGGLATATDNVTVVYDAFGFDITLIETVGVGQVELDIVDSCDTVVVVIVPESGDSVQTMKAGLMEIADIFCVNKADRPGAERIAAELQMAMDAKKKTVGGWPAPVIQTEAITKKNVDRLFIKINEHIEFQRSHGLFERHRRDQVKRKIVNILRARFDREFLDRVTAHTEFDRLVDAIISGETNPFRVGDDLYRQFHRD
jgi:LAO/AO transport system kinase